MRHWLLPVSDTNSGDTTDCRSFNIKITENVKLGLNPNTINGHGDDSVDTVKLDFYFDEGPHKKPLHKVSIIME